MGRNTVTTPHIVRESVWRDVDGEVEIVVHNQTLKRLVTFTFPAASQHIIVSTIDEAMQQTDTEVSLRFGEAMTQALDWVDPEGAPSAEEETNDDPS